MKEILKCPSILFFLTLLFLYGFIPQDGSKKTDLENMNLYGRVKSLTETTHLVGEKDYKIWKKSNSYSFNGRGNLIEENSHKKDGSVEKKFKFIYNTSHSLLEKQLYQNGIKRFTSTMKYDNRGNQIEIDWRNDKGELNSKFTYGYDEKDNQVEVTTYNRDGSIKFVSPRKFDENGNCTEWSSHKNDGKVDFKTLADYDEKHHIIELINYYKNGILKSRTTSKYDDKGNIINWKSYWQNGKVKYEYSYKYDFDHFNNWVKKTAYKQLGDNLEITERVIAY